MKRDDDYIRELLLEAEASEKPFITAPLYKSQSEESLKRHVHAHLLKDAGLVVEVNKDVFRISNLGHDYLAAIRDDGVWKKTKEGAATVGGVTLSIMMEMATSYLKLRIKEKTGLDLS